MGLPSPKFQAVLVNTTAGRAVDVSVKVIAVPSQAGAVKVKLAVAVSRTNMVRLIVSTQPPTVDV